MGKPEGCPGISVVICTLNEEQNLPYVLPKIPDWVDEVLIIDGNSTDDTVKVARDLCPQAKIILQKGKGKGNALKEGINQASGDIIVTLDADGETPPDEIEHFTEPLLKGYDFAKGSRLYKKRPSRMPLYRWFGNKGLALTCNVLYGTQFSDVCSGFNAFWEKTFLQLDPSYGKNEVGCSMEQQMIVRAKKAGMKIKEVPHTTKGRVGGTSVITGFKQSVKQGYRDWIIIIRERFHAG